MTPLEKVLGRVPDAEGNGSRFAARCPAHDDDRPGLFITGYDEGTVVVRCDEGCQPDRLLAVLGLTVADLFAPFPRRSSPEEQPTEALGRPSADAPTEDYSAIGAAILQRLAPPAIVRVGRLHGLGTGEDVAARLGRSGERPSGLGGTR